MNDYFALFPGRAWFVLTVAVMAGMWIAWA
jgi:hypothetical protein